MADKVIMQVPSGITVVVKHRNSNTNRTAVVTVPKSMAVEWSTGAVTPPVIIPPPIIITPPPVITPPPPPASVLWKAGMEGGNMSEWSMQNNGTHGLKGDGVFTSGSVASDGSSSTASRDQAHSGMYSAKLSIPGAAGACRLYPIQPSNPLEPLFYSVWYFVPQKYTVGGWTNWMQWYSSGPLWLLGMGNRSGTGAMCFSPHWWSGSLEGPTAGAKGKKTWTSPIDIPIGRWFHVEARCKWASDFSGALQIWQDNVEIFKMENVKIADGATRHWSVNNYGAGITPSPCVIYIDDVAIAKTRIG